MKQYLPSLGLALLLALDSIGPNFLHESKWIQFFFFLSLHYSNQQILRFALESTPKNFAIYYFISQGIRFILSILFILIFVYFKVENVLEFACTFFAFYFYYIVFEIYYLLGNLQANK
ncbi:MAG: hypothetical protein AAFU64_04755 [Bacteroidota bacterium]